MTNIKATKRALGSSVLALFLCFAMLLGTTFAWFTDSVTSANNIITAGNLDVELEYWNGTEWVDVAEKSDILTNELWEPGVTEVAYLRVANAGSLALKYQLGINIVSEKAGTNKAGKSFLLSDYIQFGVVEGVNGETNAYANRNAAVEAVKEAKKISAGYTKKNTLYSATNIPADIEGATSEEYIALVVYMPETVGDEANHNGDAPTINLGINVVATQVTAENDSYGPDYDANAPICNVIVESEEALKEALANAKNGDVIGISGKDVTWTTGAGIGSTPFNGENKDLSYITLVGVGEDATFTAIGAGVGAIGIDNGTVIFKNLKIADQSVSYAENSWEYGYLEFRGNTVFENCEIVNAIMMEGDSATFKNCSFNSNKDSEYAVWVSDGEVSFENCYITGARGIKVHEAYGSEVKSVVINNNRFENLTKKPGLAIGTVNADTTITITNNIFAGTQAYETDTDVTTFNFNFTEESNTFADYVDTNTALKDAIKNDAIVALPKGEFELPSMSGKEGVTLIGAADGSTVIGGENTSTGFGGNFGKNTTIKNITFSGNSNGVRYSYAQGGTTVFENCTFAGDSTYGFHIDESNGATFIFNNCTFSGFNAFAADLEKVVFNNCTFLNNGNYGHTNIWSVGEFNNCTWGEGATFGPRSNAVIYIDGVRAIYSAEELAAALTADKKDISVLLMNDIDLPISSLGQITGGSGEYKLGGENTETITIDLNGKKLNITTTYWSNLGAKNDNAIFTIKNGSMTSSQASGTWNSYDLTFSNCDYVIENVVFEKAVAFDNAGKNVTLKGVTINETHDYYALWITAAGQNVTIDGLTINSAGRGIKIDEQYVGTPAKVTLKVSNAKFTTASKAAIMVKSAAGADITVDNVDISNVAKDTTNVVWVDEDAATSAGLVNVTGGTKIVEA